MRIRKTVSGDRQSLVQTVEETANLTGEEKKCAIELLDIYFNNPLQKDYFFMTATDASESPIGYVCYGGRPLTEAVYDLYWIVVAPEWRGKGVGKRLLERTEEALKALGGRMLLAETSGLPAYESARGFYVKTGFREEARITGFYRPGDDLVVYIKRF
ncbi:MAG: GNAT family N-acetyltransferase [Deltaproteobacteria bacterium]|nr:GNAT family N-acetyltransferase [Deltaproteobacteria bacterium]